MFIFIYTLLTFLVFGVIALSLYFKIKNFKKSKKIGKEPTKRNWWQNILLVILRLIFLVVGIFIASFLFLFVRSIFN